MTLDELKEFLNITKNDQDKLLEMMLDLANDMIEQELGYSLTEKEYTEALDVENTSMLFLKAPIVSVKSITGAKVDHWSKNVVYLEKKTRGRVVINYTWGFASLPKSLAFAMLNLAKELYQIHKTNGLEIKSKKVDVLSITYFSPEEQKKGSTARSKSDLVALLAPYKLLYYTAL